MATASTNRADDNSWHVVTLRDVAWETYCQLRDEPANRRIRMEYLDGSLTLLSPESIQDRGAESLGLVIRGVTSGLGLEVKATWTATLRKGTARRKGAGKEPDNAFYIQALDQADPMGETAWKRWLRAWAVELPEPSANA